MAGDSGGKEQNYWPGFVDALSNVVLTLVFVLVVFVFALVITSGKVKQKSAQMVEQQVEAEKVSQKRVGELEQQMKLISEQRDKIAAELMALKQQNAKQQVDLEELRKLAEQLQAFKLSVVEKERSVTPSIIEQRVDLKVDPSKPREQNKENPDVEQGKAIVVTYPRTVVMLNEQAKANLAKVLEGYRGRLAGTKAVIDSYTGTETYSEGRRMAYYRGLDLRNFLMDRKLATAETIVINTLQPKEPGDARIELRFSPK